MQNKNSACKNSESHMRTSAEFLFCIFWLFYFKLFLLKNWIWIEIEMQNKNSAKFLCKKFMRDSNPGPLKRRSHALTTASTAWRWPSTKLSLLSFYLVTLRSSSAWPGGGTPLKFSRMRSMLTSRILGKFGRWFPLNTSSSSLVSHFRLWLKKEQINENE